jgi:RNA polymerase sigma factor (sigma-70 family)
MKIQTKTELFDKLYRDFSDRVYAYHSACTGSNNAADLTQQTFLNLWRYINKTQTEPDNYRAWIFRVAVNVKNDFLRQKQRHPPSLEYNEELDSEICQDDHMTETAVVKIALSHLTDGQREVLLLCSMGLNSGETGRALGITASAARSRLVKARLEFKNHLQECGVIIGE